MRRIFELTGKYEHWLYYKSERWWIQSYRQCGWIVLPYLMIRNWKSHVPEYSYQGVEIGWLSQTVRIDFYKHGKLLG